MNCNKKTPIICVDLKKNRIRVHKTTLELLGYPVFIQLLINPDTSEIVLHRSVEEDYLAHKITYGKNKRNSYELYSLDLLHRIRAVSPNLSDNYSFRIEGTVDKKGTLARFQLTDAVRMGVKEVLKS